MEFLSVGLPQDVQREIFAGDIGRAIRIIDRKLKENLPTLLFKRLSYEKERIQRVLKDYPYSLEEAKKVAKEKIKGFTDFDFEALFDAGVLDYIILNGEPYFEERFAFNIGFALSEFKDRVKTPLNVLRSKELLAQRLERLVEGDKAKNFVIRAKISVFPNYESIRGDKIRVWLPFPRVGFQVKSARLISTSHGKYELSDDSIGQKTIYFEDSTGNRSIFYVEFEYKIREWLNRIEPEKVKQGISESAEEFLKQKPPHILFTHYLKDLTREVVGNESNPYLKAKRIYDWITLNVKYSYVRPYAVYENIPTFVATNLKGDCGFQALLFITMCRIAGIPARWQSGWYINEYFASPHDWALFYIEPYGWIPADLSFGGARRDVPKFRNFYFGNLDGFRMIANVRFMEKLQGKKHWRTDPYDNQIGEIETEIENVYYDNYEYKIELTGFKEE